MEVWGRSEQHVACSIPVKPVGASCLRWWSVRSAGGARLAQREWADIVGGQRVAAPDPDVLVAVQLALVHQAGLSALPVHLPDAVIKVVLRLPELVLLPGHQGRS